MSSSDKDFEEQLVEVGKELLKPPSSLEDLFPLLDKAEYFLSRVEQSPSKSIERALSPCMRALIADKLFKHTDIDVKIAVAACISEITRISAPEAPYNDDLMKEAFQLIISSFEHLDDRSSRSYEKRASILATVAKVRSCVVMLDLECDSLILEMFQNFLTAIRDYHPEHVFSSMETVMTLVIEESEDISPQLLSPILATLKRDNEGVRPIAKKLGEKVLENSASRLKPSLAQALKSLGTSVDDYSEVVSSICRDNNTGNNRTHVNAAGEHEVDNEATSPKSEVSSGVKQRAQDDRSTDSISTKEPENADQKTQMEITGVSSDDKSGESDDAKEIKTASQPKKATRKGGRKQSTVKKSTKPADGTHTDDEKEAEQSLDNDKDAKTDLLSSLREDKSAETGLPLDGEKQADVASSPKEEQNESIAISSPLKSAKPENIEGSSKEFEESSDLEGKANAEVGKRTEDEAPDEDRALVTVKTSKESGATDDAETNSEKQSSQKAHASTEDKDGTSTKSLENKKGVKGKVGRLKHDMNSSRNDAEKQAVSSLKSGKKRQRDDDQPDDTPTSKVKGKRTPVKEMGSNAKDYGKDLVGSKVKVWWPEDKRFYKGLVDSFDSVSKKHRIVYDDGDVENLHLKGERWELVEDDSSSSEGQAAEEETRDTSPDVRSKKLLGKTLKGQTAKSGGNLKKLKSGGSAKGKYSSSKPKTKKSEVVVSDSGEECDESNKREKGKGMESSKTPLSGRKAGGYKTPGSRTPGSGTKLGGYKTAGSGSKTGKKRGREV